MFTRLPARVLLAALLLLTPMAGAPAHAQGRPAPPAAPRAVGDATAPPEPWTRGYHSSPVRFPPSDLVLRVDMGPGYYVNVRDHVRAALHTDVTVGLRLMLGVLQGRRRVHLSVDPELGYAYESFPESPTHAARAGFAVMFHLFEGWLAAGPALSFVIGYGNGELALGGRVEARVLLLQRIMLLQAGYEVLHAGGTHHQFRMVVGIDMWAAVRLGLNLMKPRPWALL